MARYLTFLPACNHTALAEQFVCHASTSIRLRYPSVAAFAEFIAVFPKGKLGQLSTHKGIHGR